MIIKKICKLTGVSFGDCQENIRRFGGRGMSYNLVRENNEYDEFAIRVMLCDEWMMGYIPKWLSCKLAPSIDEGYRYSAWFVSKGTNEEGLSGITVSIEQE